MDISEEVVIKIAQTDPKQSFGKPLSTEKYLKATIFDISQLLT